ncbi:hypothetical protein BGY98DRAFT_295205 [Russula aff. rugulosa BPL654]|nr:hypothetical protein BGY98DRAFT_295205 [Russula aff. rugulosa BPL654]
MFKRVDRRRKRKEKEERLGLDEDQLGVFGLHHTDSSESESDSSDSASTSSSDGLALQSRKKRKREVSPPSYDEDDEDEDGEPATDEEEDEGDSDHGSHPLLTIASALKEPIRPDSDSETWVCAFCPGKTLKHAAMVKVHEASRIHRQRFKRMQELAMKFRPDEDIRTVLAKSSTDTQPKGGSETLSLRAQKRMAKQAKLKEKRKKIKEKKAIAIENANAKKAVGIEPKTGDTSDSDEESHAPKRSKVASRDPPAKNVHKTSVRVQAKGRGIPTDAGRSNRKETAGAPVSEKSKRGRRMGEQTTLAH